MIVLDPDMVSRVLSSTSGVQHRFDHTQKPLKLDAKKTAAGLLGTVLQDGGKVLDVGGEAFYVPFFAAKGFDVVPHNLPQDMHEMTYQEEFDAVTAMHVLEHSPFPLYVLHLIARALKPSGWLYIAVPKPCTKFCQSYGHQSVMPAAMWATLIKQAGFRIHNHHSGKFGAKKRWVEERFLCQKAEA